MKYSFFSSACAWLPSALMMAVSASGASSAPLASFVKYVPETHTQFLDLKNNVIFKDFKMASFSQVGKIGYTLFEGVRVQV